MPAQTEKTKGFFEGLDREISNFPKERKEPEASSAQPEASSAQPSSAESPPKKVTPQASSSAPPLNDDGDDDDIFSGRKKKPTKEDSLKVIKQERDKHAADLKVYKEVFGDEDPNVVKPLYEFLVARNENGIVTPEEITSLLDRFSNSEKRIQELEQELESKEGKISELDIRESVEFENNFKKPYEEASETLFLEYANIGEDNKLIAPNATQAFDNFIKNTEGINAATVKAALQKFVKEYKEESGEDPIVPSVSSLMSSIRVFNDKKQKVAEAYKDWKTTKEEAEKTNALNQQKESAALQAKHKKERSSLASKAYREFDLGEDSIIEDDDLKSMFQEEYKLGESFFDGSSAPPPYDQLIARGVKSRLWDKYFPKLVALLQKEQEEEEKSRSHRPGVQRQTVGSSSDNKDWLGGIS